MERTNKLFVVGELKEVNIRKGVDSSNKNYVAGDIKVEVTPTNILSLSFYSREFTNEGKENARYANYSNLETMINKRIKVTGEIQGRAFYSKQQGQVIAFNELSAGFINLASDIDANTATFEFGGFVSKPLYEKTNKDNEIYAYEIEVGQADYSGDRLGLVKFQINPGQANIIRAVESSYLKNSTIIFSGEVIYENKTETRTEEVAFGDPIVKTFTSVIKSFLITGGKEPVLGDNAYTAAQIAKLESAYNEYILKVASDAKEQASSTGSAVSNSAAKTSVNSLI